MRILALSFALLLGACSRGHYTTAPQPAAPKPVTQAGTPLAVVVSKAGPPASLDAVDFLLLRGMQIPVAGVALKQLHDTFDEGRDGVRVHRALDIMAPRGTAVLAADSGQVLRIGFNSLGGNCLYASDPFGRVVYYYAHLDAYYPGLVQGSTIARGDTLGYVGTTGNAPKDTPHLHFQVMRMASDGHFWDGEPINPYPLFLLMYDGHP